MRRIDHAFTRGSILLACVVLLSQGSTIRADGGTMTLEQLLELVRQNELLYSDIDVTIRDEYETGSMPDKASVAKFGVGTVKTVHKEVSRHRYVAQGEWYHMEWMGTWIFARDDQQDVIHLRQYDGEITRGRTGGVANVIYGRKDCAMPIQAHALFPRMGGQMWPLSVYLRGNAPLGRKPEPGSSKRWFAEYKGERDCEGERCYEVELTSRIIKGAPGEGKVVRREIFWLSKMRNLIPVRANVYDHEGVTPVLSGEAVVNTWLEIEPGVWFPKHVEFRTWNRFLLRDTGRRVLQWRRVYTVESISLKPNYPQSFFRTVIFPEGTLVYEFKDNKELRSYRVGSPQDPHAVKNRAASGTRWVLLVLGCAAVFATIVGIVFLRHRRKERT